MLDLATLTTAVKSAAAIRGRAILEPAGGPGDKVFPPTHSVANERTMSREDERHRGVKYARERRHIDGYLYDVVLLDSVQSQANRMEEALQVLWSDGEIVLPVIAVDFGEAFPDLRGISSLTAPHRVSDALLRDSLLDGVPFRHSDLGSSFNDTTASNALPLFNVCPTALVFGLWDSTRPRGGLGFRLARNLTSEIAGIGAVFGTKTSSRLDPTGVVKKPFEVYRADAEKAPLEQWTPDPASAETDSDGNPVRYGKKERAGTATAINHSNVPPSWDVLAGGVSIARAEQTVVLSLSGLRRLSFTGEADGDLKARTVLASLGLLAAVAAADRGYDLRSRCVLVPRRRDGEKPGALAFQRIAKDGVATDFELDIEGAKKLYQAAVAALPDAMQWRKRGTDELVGPAEPLATLVAADKLKKLVEESRKAATPDESEDD